MTDGIVDLSEIEERHASYTVPIEGKSAAYCKACGIPWPCDANRLLALMWVERNRPFARWRGLCGHEWYAEPGDHGEMPACAICLARVHADRLALALARVYDEAKPR
jgi:hypothetical protein